MDNTERKPEAVVVEYILQRQTRRKNRYGVRPWWDHFIAQEFSTAREELDRHLEFCDNNNIPCENQRIIRQEKALLYEHILCP